MRLLKLHERKFIECKACADKPGSPTLCTPCIENRDLIAQWKARAEDSTLRHAQERIDTLQKRVEELEQECADREVQHQIAGKFAGEKAAENKILRKALEAVRAHIAGQPPKSRDMNVVVFDIIDPALKGETHD